MAVTVWVILEHEDDIVKSCSHLLRPLQEVTAIPVLPEMPLPNALRHFKQFSELKSAYLVIAV